MMAKKVTARLSDSIVHVFFILAAIGCIYPIALIIAISISEVNSIFEAGYRLFPKKLNFLAYEFILKNPQRLLNSYLVTILVTVAGSLTALTVTAMLAYAISRKEFKYGRQISFAVVFTMLFNGGLVPWYMVVTNVLHIKNTIFALILPYVVLAWFVMLLRTFFAALPNEVIEAAEIDGSSEFSTFLKIIIPMSKPAIAAVGFLIVLRYWNDWWLSMLFIENSRLNSLQYMLFALMSTIDELAKDAQVSGSMDAGDNFPSESARMAMAVLAGGPMLFVFPFFQKYFVKGITLGALKG